VEDETRALTSALDEQLTREARQLEDKRERLHQVRARTAAENAARVREVAARLQKYGEIDRTLVRARLKVEALGGGEERE
jgi:DNA-binding protein H-NS